MKTNNKVYSVIVYMVLVFVISTSAFAIQVNDNPVWPDELGAKPDFNNLKGEKIKLTFWNFSTGMTDYFETVIEEFKKLYVDLDLEIVYQEVAYQQIHQSLITSIIAGQGAADIVTLNISETPKFFTPPFAANFREIKLSDELKKDLIKQEPYTDSNGKLRGVEVAGPHPGFMFYRKDLFDKAGIEMPIETWDEFIEAGLKMKEKLGIPITSFPITKQGFFQNHLLAVQNGNPFYNEEGEFVFNDEKAVEALQLIKDMVYKYEIADDANPTAPITLQRLSGENKDYIASMMAPLWVPVATIYNSETEETKGQWRVAPLPKFANSPYRTSTQGGTALSIVESQSDYPQVAEALVKLLISKENQIRKFKEISYLPVLKSALNSEEVRSFTKPEVFGDQPVGEIFAEYTSQLPPIKYGKGSLAVMEEIRNRFNELKDMDVKTWLANLADFALEQE